MTPCGVACLVSLTGSICTAQISIAITAAFMVIVPRSASFRSPGNSGWLCSHPFHFNIAVANVCSHPVGSRLKPLSSILQAKRNLVDVNKFPNPSGTCSKLVML
ncbi:hypothetical protein EDD37DRAFT_642448 [Exophiala viscosa]|uniref:Uncharacterized protein n=1 Tax=Exophiala viscosa TaxID=2486360 RepID=A0AAN6DVV9_9EURO|nr:hypothetical protein EDD36DRAFT_436769 [Exophiala viscosa]KAI1619863.1 hypothetical protein EDD37DRAFT_642448 [Exophiala viscosa]